MYFDGTRVDINFPHSLHDSTVKMLRAKASGGGFCILEADDGNYYVTRATDPYHHKESSGSGLLPCPEKYVSPHIFSTTCIPCSNRTEYLKFPNAKHIPGVFCGETDETDDSNIATILIIVGTIIGGLCLFGALMYALVYDYPCCR